MASKSQFNHNIIWQGSAMLDKHWKSFGGIKVYKTVACSLFPNFFLFGEIHYTITPQSYLSLKMLSILSSDFPHLSLDKKWPQRKSNINVRKSTVISSKQLCIWA